MKTTSTQWGLRFSLLFVLGCLPNHPTTTKHSTVHGKKLTLSEVSFTPSPKPQVTPPATPSPSPSRIDPVSKPSFTTLFYRAKADADPSKILQILERTPRLKVNFIFPPKYFEPVQRRIDRLRFKSLQSSGTIEIGLTLENEPNLPLIGDLRLADKKVESWGFEFNWKEDIAAQLALGSAQYQKSWGVLPSGFAPPFNSLSEDVLESLQKFRMNWTLGIPSSRPGVQYFGSTALLVPQEIPSFGMLTPGTTEWALAISSWTLDQSLVFVDGDSFDTAEAEYIFFAGLEKGLRHRSTDYALLTGLGFTDKEADQMRFKEKIKISNGDLSSWVQNKQQRLAWQALADARHTLQMYKNSGHANLRNLDAASNEIYNAESGPFLLALGQSQMELVLNQRNFLATLANVYRLCGVPVPSTLYQTFEGKKWEKAPSTQRIQNDRPFFIEGESQMTWNDPIGDDVGGGAITYPIGKYTKGTFDLTQFQLSWTESQVNFTIGLGALTTEGALPINPIVDVYIDVNKLSNAGELNSLPGRGLAGVQNEAAWEFALSVSPLSASLYQPAGGNFKRLQSVTVQADSANKTLSLSLPRSLFRGDPQNWRMSVGLAGGVVNPVSREITIIPVQATSTDRSFGGNTQSSRMGNYIDLLLPTFDDQKARYQNFSTVSKLILGYVEKQ